MEDRAGAKPDPAAAVRLLVLRAARPYRAVRAPRVPAQIPAEAPARYRTPPARRAALRRAVAAVARAMPVPQGNQAASSKTASLAQPATANAACVSSARRSCRRAPRPPAVPRSRHARARTTAKASTAIAGLSTPSPAPVARQTVPARTSFSRRQAATFRRCSRQAQGQPPTRLSLSPFACSPVTPARRAARRSDAAAASSQRSLSNPTLGSCEVSVRCTLAL